MTTAQSQDLTSRSPHSRVVLHSQEQSVVGRPGSLIEENNEYVQVEEQADEDLVGIGVCLNVTNKGEVV